MSRRAVLSIIRKGCHHLLSRERILTSVQWWHAYSPFVMDFPSLVIRTSIRPFMIILFDRLTCKIAVPLAAKRTERLILM